MKSFEGRAQRQELTEEIRGWLEEFADGLATEAQNEGIKRIDVPTLRTRITRYLIEMYGNNLINKSCRGISVARGTQPILEWTEDMNALILGLNDGDDWRGPKFVIPASEVLFPSTKQ